MRTLKCYLLLPLIAHRKRSRLQITVAQPQNSTTTKKTKSDTFHTDRLRLSIIFKVLGIYICPNEKKICI